MTDREERQHVIEILQKERKTALHDNKWAFDYAISSIEIDLKYDLLYEETSGQADKNDLGVTSGLEKNSKKLEKDFGESDCISRQATVKRLCKLAEFLNEHKENSGAPYIVAALFIQDNKTEFPPVTPQEPKSEWEHDHEILRAYADGANNVLDKLRAEIDKARFIDKDTRIAKNALASGLEVAMQIIDKYKAETENP